jgi:hypothetical protein
MNARIGKADAYLITASLMVAISLLNVVAWSLGLYVTPFLALFVAVIFFLIYAKGSPSSLIILAVFLLFTVLILGGPVWAWDARSIWFFHAKRIFFDGSLYAQLDDYVPTSHNDYPDLVPAAAASIAKTLGYWNEIFPRLAVLPVLFPAFLVFRRLIAKHEIFALWLAGTLIICRKMLLNGYMDAILALYCAAATLLITITYSRNMNAKPAEGENVALMALFWIIATLPFIKNEGLLASVIMTGILFTNFRRYKVLIFFLLVSLAFYFLIWKLEVIQHHVQTDIFSEGFVQRGMARISDWASISMILGKYLAVSFWALPLLILFVYIGPKSVPTVPVVLFVAIYSIAMMTIYLITPMDLLWHLRSSAYRTYLVTNFCVYSWVIYSLDRALVEPAAEADLPKPNFNSAAMTTR